MKRGALLVIVLVACADRRAEIASSTPPAMTAATPTTTATATAPPPASSLPSPPPTPADLSLGPGHWCTEGLDALDDETCIVVPPAIAAPRALLIYLHGVIAPSGRPQRVVQSVVASRARARGFVAMMPRGRRGIGPKNIKDWWAWPTSADAHLRHSKEIVSSWTEKRARLEARLGLAFDRVYLAGSSNGAYYISILALKGEFAADGFGAMSGGNGAGRTKDTIVESPRPPFYVGWGARDDTNEDPKSLAALLKSAAWPTKSAEHPVGHGAREVYVDEAFDFWTAN